MSDQLREKLRRAIHEIDPFCADLLGDSDDTFRPDLGDSWEPDTLDQEVSDLTRTMSVKVTPEQSIEIAAELTGLSVARIRAIQEKKPIWATLTRTAYDPNRLTFLPKIVEKRVKKIEELISEFKQAPCFQNFQGQDCEEVWHNLTAHCFELVQNAVQEV